MLDVDSVQVRSEPKVIKSERAVANEVTACFTEGTVVATPEGKVSIESIQEGDSVYAYNEQTKAVETRSVTATSKRWYEGRIIYIVVGADTIQATREHPFYVEGSWVEAEDLKVGDRLTLLGERTDNVQATWSRDTALFVYNFTVEEQHTYYVSNSGVLVHNQCDANLFSNFKNLDELARMFKGKNLGNATDDLLNSGWTKVSGDWGSKTIFEKQIGKERYYAIWEPANIEHSINNLTTSYWKLTKGKISAYGDNVRRVSDAVNFKP